ncbi:MAG: hypothetical protein L0211_13610 [Planctomycetaceae bacterium]|nr:hypothetical protein [Planctomycetaceae bacterium]
MLTENGSPACETQIRADQSHQYGANLIDAALRSTRRALKLWREAAFDEALESLIEARQGISKLIEGLPLDDLPASQEAEGKYIRLLSMLIEAQQTCDAWQLEEAILLLEGDCIAGQEASAEQSVVPVPPPTAAFAGRADVNPTVTSRQSAFAMDA